MAPDLNSLPPSRPAAASPAMARSLSNSTDQAAALRTQTPSPSRAASTSLQAAAAVNAGLQRSPRGSLSRNRQTSSAAGRRRSTVFMNLQLNDPSVPGPGEMISEGHSSRRASPSMSGSPIIPSGGGDPHHYRNPSLGEIHQTLEQESEAQVNRLLAMIRSQQQQLQQLHAASGQTHPPAIDESTPTSERSMSFSTSVLPPPMPSLISPRSPSSVMHSRSSFDIARADLQRRSRTPSRTASPRQRATSISNETGEPWSLSGGGRDENAFYQAETQMMIRENQMLRQRIRELERQVNEQNVNSSITREPATRSSLLRSTSASDETSEAAQITSIEESKDD